MFRITVIGTDISAHLSMIAAVNAFSLFTAYQILSSDFYFQGALTTAWRRVTIQHPWKKEWGLVLYSDHLVWPCDLIYDWPHSYCSFSKLTTCFQLTFAMCCGIIFMEAFAEPISDVASRHLHRWAARLLFCFSLLFHTSKWWPHIIFSDTDLTTFLTIVTSGVHGDKMSGEYEKAVFA